MIVDFLHEPSSIEQTRYFLSFCYRITHTDRFFKKQNKKETSSVTKKKEKQANKNVFIYLYLFKSLFFFSPLTETMDHINMKSLREL